MQKSGVWKKIPNVSKIIKSSLYSIRTNLFSKSAKLESINNSMK